MRKGFLLLENIFDPRVTSRLMEFSSPVGDKESIVYAIKVGDYVKFGVTTSLGNRIRAYETHNPHEIELLGWIRGEFAIENIIHCALKEQRVRGEWFHYSGQAKAVASLMSDPDRAVLLCKYLTRISAQE